jgi:hypothetical protein
MPPLKGKKKREEEEEADFEDDEDEGFEDEFKPKPKQRKKAAAGTPSGTPKKKAGKNPTGPFTDDKGFHYIPGESSLIYT